MAIEAGIWKPGDGDIFNREFFEGDVGNVFDKELLDEFVRRVIDPLEKGEPIQILKIDSFTDHGHDPMAETLVGN